MRYSLKIKFDYPSIYGIIIKSLNKLNMEEDLEETFPNIDKNFIGKIRKMLSIENRILNLDVYENAFKEAGVLD